jgi:tetratricopeptide (TPR) repeat protein
MFFGSDEREVLPRWRSYEATLRHRELSGLGGRNHTPRPRRADFEVDLRLAEWREHRTPSYAADLLAAAIMLGDEQLIAEAASAVQAFGLKVPLLGRAVAERALLSVTSANRTHSADLREEAESRQPRVANLRQRLRRDQRNAIAWAELARFHAISGNRRPAKRAMLSATSLAPDNRFILRSATRLAVHLGEPDWGHHLLRSSARTSVDPWLAAAEISVSAISGQSSRMVKVGRRMLASQNYSHLDLAELAAALGTREMDTSRRRAKRLFETALQDPNENAVAQAVWATRGVDWLDIDPNLFDLPDSYEARARTHAEAGERSAAVDQSWQWMNDEPFALQPPAFGSYQACVGEVYEEGTRLAVAGLTANPTDFTLLNNATFCFANMGEIDEAEKYFARIRFNDLKDRNDRAVYFATQGLLNYRVGAVEEGRQSYTRSLGSTRDASIRAVAAIMFAREELWARTDRASEIIRQAFEFEEAAQREGGEMASEVRAWLRHLQGVLAHETTERR